MNELISVIIPVYKTEKYLAECVESALRQTYGNLEIILVDDGSPDGCPAMCDRYKEQDDRVKVIHQPNSGVSAARNAGLDIAKGEYIAFLDSDDWYEPEMLEMLLAAIHRDHTRLSVGGMHYIYEDRSLSNRIQDRFYNTVETVADEVISREDCINRYFSSYRTMPFTVLWNKLYHRDIFRDLRFPVGKLFEDPYVVMDILAQVDRISCVSRKLYQYRQRAGSIVHTKEPMQSLDHMEAYVRIVTHLVEHGYRSSAVYMQAYVMLFAQEFGLRCKCTEAYVRRRKELTRDLVEQLDRVSIKSAGLLFYVMIRVVALWAKLTSHKRIRPSEKGLAS